jgi:hypothetical protein
LGGISVLGSVLLWAVLSRATPSNPLFRILLALGSSWAMIRVKMGYLGHIDKAVEKGN